MKIINIRPAVLGVGGAHTRRWLLTAIAVGGCLLGRSLDAQVRVPGFKPSSSGLHFINSFPSIPLLTINIAGTNVPIGDASNGLCGGMGYVVRDYYQAGLLPPPLTTDSDGFSRPPQVVFDYLVKRLFDSFNLLGGPIKYMSLMNPALPDHETDASRIGLAPHGRAWVMIIEEWPKIKAELDLGFPSPMALLRVKSLDPFQMGNNHQVLAYGYDFSGADLTIHVYDPNYPGRDDITVTLSIQDPQHTTAVTYSTGEQMNCFFHPDYVFDSPPVTPCSTVQRSDLSLFTGVDSSGVGIPNGLADSTYEVTAPGANPICATVVPDDDYPIGPWLGFSSFSKWIGLRKRASNGQAGRYSFLTRLNVPGNVNPAALAIVGKWTSDDATVDVRVNGVSTGVSNTGDFTVLSPFPDGTGLGLFQAGQNTVEFLVDNGVTGAENPVGLRVRASVNVFGHADLAVSSLVPRSSSVLAGGLLTVDLTTSNIGNLVCGATLTRLYLSQDASFSGSDVFLGELAVPALCAGCASSGSLAVTVPSGTPAGSYTILACANGSSSVEESGSSNNCLAGSAVAVQGSPPPGDCWRADFAGRRALTGWVAPSGEWSAFAGALTGTSAGDDEAWIWAPGQVESGSRVETYSFDLQLVDASDEPSVGRHGGVMFCSSSQTSRMDPSTSGYTLDWIDRAGDHGLRLIRWDNAVPQPLQVGTPQLADPPRSWRVALDSRSIKVFADGILIMDVADSTYRSGYFGVWSFLGQTIHVDNLSYGTACGSSRKPFDLNQDGGLDLSDCVSLLGFLFLGKPQQLPCGDGTPEYPSNKTLADHNGDSRIDLSDAVAALAYFFLGGPPHVAGDLCIPLEGCPELSGGSCP